MNMGFFAKQRTKGIPKNKEFSPLRDITFLNLSPCGGKEGMPSVKGVSSQTGERESHAIKKENQPLFSSGSFFRTDSFQKNSKVENII